MLAVVGLLTCGAISSAAAATEGVAKVEFTTETVSGKYAPRHVVAVWVADSGTNFIKTVLRLGNKRHTKLHAWNAARQGNSAVDGVTGATLAQHEALSATWNGTDSDNKPMPDGSYFFVIEFTESNNQGPLAHLPFTKGPQKQNHDVEGLKHFPKVKVTFTPAGK